mmetsp:Transcript_2910/g.8488  ORF Transcript_2910/g.8488 Transcript_2910/m.8488 type:complete len:180 (-) Transcript_2910:1009-1548(-)
MCMLRRDFILSFTSVAAFLLSVRKQCTAFVQPASLTTSNIHVPVVELHALPPLPDLSHVGSFLISASNDIGIEEAFKDDIQFIDPTIKLELGVFAAVVLLLVAASALLGQMDNAIEKVLGDFEKTMKSKYASKWIEIEDELEGLGSAERTQKLGAIMERMQKEEPKLMERVNADMASFN